jgi:pyruvate formate lyase activating enzyme
MKCADVCTANAIERVGQKMSADEIIAKVIRDRAFYGETGGITITGGEPMFQPQGCITLLQAAKENGLSTAIETCGYFSEKYIEELCSVTDYFLWDLKDGVSERHKKYTGVDNQKIIRNLFQADLTTKHILLRCIMVRGVNIDAANLCAIANIFRQLKHCDGVELIPYHAYGGSKSEQLGGQDNGRKEWIPSDDDIKWANEYLAADGVNIKK